MAKAKKTIQKGKKQNKVVKSAVVNPVGRPKKFQTPEAMQLAINSYLKRRKNPTICGLALALGFNSRQSLLNYEGYSAEFMDTIKRARLIVEESYEKGLRSGKPIGPIFALKNFGWTDKQEIEHSGEIKSGVLVVPTGLDKDEWLKAAQSKKTQ